MRQGEIFRLEEVDVAEEFGFGVVGIEDGLLEEFRGSLEAGRNSVEFIKAHFRGEIQLLLALKKSLGAGRTSLMFLPQRRDATCSSFSIVVVSLRDKVMTLSSVSDKETMARAGPLARLGRGTSLRTVRVSKYVSFVIV
jgi:hypothetical protein